MPKETPSLDYLALSVRAALVETMYPNFALFCETSDHPGKLVYRHALNLVWEYASGRTELINFAGQQEKLEACIPDPAEYDVFGVRPALDACVALILLLQSCDEPQEDDLQSLQDLSRSTIEDYLDIIAFDGDIEQHPLIRRQHQLISDLQDLVLQDKEKDRRKRVDLIRITASDNGLSNIGISID